VLAHTGVLSVAVLLWVCPDVEAAAGSPGALHAGLYKRRLGRVLAHDEHSLARLSTPAPLLRQGLLLTYLLTYTFLLAYLSQRFCVFELRFINAVGLLLCVVLW